MDLTTQLQSCWIWLPEGVTPRPPIKVELLLLLSSAGAGRALQQNNIELEGVWGGRLTCSKVLEDGERTRTSLASLEMIACGQQACLYYTVAQDKLTGSFGGKWGICELRKLKKDCGHDAKETRYVSSPGPSSWNLKSGSVHTDKPE